MMRKHQWTWLARMLALITVSGGWWTASPVTAHPNRTSTEALEVTAQVDASNNASAANAPQEVSTTKALTVPPAKVKTINKPARVDSGLDLDTPKQEITITLAPEAWTTARAASNGNVEVGVAEAATNMTISESVSASATTTEVNGTTAPALDVVVEPQHASAVQAVAARVFSTQDSSVVTRALEATTTHAVSANTAITLSNAGASANVPAQLASNSEATVARGEESSQQLEAVDVDAVPSAANSDSSAADGVDSNVAEQQPAPQPVRQLYPEVETLPLDTIQATPLIPVRLNPVPKPKYIQHVNLEDFVYSYFIDVKFDPLNHLPFSADLYPLTSNIITFDQQLETLQDVAKGKALLDGAQKLVKAFMMLQYERTDDDDILNARYNVRFQGRDFEMVNRSAHPDYTYINEFVLFAQEFNQECQATNNFSVNWKQVADRLVKADYAREKPQALAEKGSFYPDILAQSCKFFTTYGSVLPQLLQSYNYTQLFFTQSVQDILLDRVPRQTMVYPVPLEVIARIAEVSLSVPDQPFYYSWSPEQQEQFLAQYKVANDRILELQYQYNNKAYANWYATQITLSRNDEYDEGLMVLRGDYLPILNLYSVQRLCEETRNWNITPNAVRDASHQVIAYGATHNKVFNQFCSVPYNKIENLRLELQRRYEVYAPELDNQQ